MREKKRGGVGKVPEMMVQSGIVALSCIVGSLGETRSSRHSKRSTLMEVLTVCRLS